MHSQVKMLLAGPAAVAVSIIISSQAVAGGPAPLLERGTNKSGMCFIHHHDAENETVHGGIRKLSECKTLARNKAAKKGKKLCRMHGDREHRRGHDEWIIPVNTYSHWLPDEFGYYDPYTVHAKDGRRNIGFRPNGQGDWGYNCRTNRPVHNAGDYSPE